MTALARLLWSETSKTAWLLLAAAALVLGFLGTAELWTHEGRWAVICLKMMRTGNYVHPYQFDETYYDKPLLTYWIMIGFARVLGGLHEWAMRLPSALSAIGTVWCTYRLGLRMFDRVTGLLAGWILTTCVLFIFWGRVAAADMMSLFASTAAVAWYVERRDRPGWMSHFVFFLILAVGCQMKGLVSAVVAVLAILPDFLRERRWRKHLTPSLFLTPLPALAVYLVPFLISHYADPQYGESGLMQVFNENIKRYFRAFDHKDPVYTYLIYLPVLLIPWSPLLFPAVYRVARNWKTLPPGTKWAAWASLLIFLMFTASSSRRGYYILPILPFAALLIADWIRVGSERRMRAAAGLTVAGAIAAISWFWIAVPVSLQYGGFRKFSADVRRAAEPRAPWSEWTIVLYDSSPHSAYYLQTGRDPKRLPTREAVRDFVRENPRSIVITGQEEVEEMKKFVPCDVTVPLQFRIPPSLLRFQDQEDRAVALIPP